MAEGLTALHLAAVNNCFETANVLLKNVSTASTLQTKINMQTKTKTRSFYHQPWMQSLSLMLFLEILRRQHKTNISV